MDLHQGPNRCDSNRLFAAVRMKWSLESQAGLLVDGAFKMNCLYPRLRDTYWAYWFAFSLVPLFYAPPFPPSSLNRFDVQNKRTCLSDSIWFICLNAAKQTRKLFTKWTCEHFLMQHLYLSQKIALFLSQCLRLPQNETPTKLLELNLYLVPIQAIQIC